MINSVCALKVKRKSNATKDTSGTYRMQDTHVWKESPLLKFVLTACVTVVLSFSCFCEYTLA